jgi:hypothetical protein
MDSHGQLDISDVIASARERELASTQTRELARVTSRIGRACLDFARAHVGREFVGEYLLRWVREATGKNCAPDSPRRVLAELEAQGWLKTECVSRAGSKYRIVEVAQ